MAKTQTILQLKRQQHQQKKPRNVVCKSITGNTKAKTN